MKYIIDENKYIMVLKYTIEEKYIWWFQRYAIMENKYLKVFEMQIDENKYLMV